MSRSRIFALGVNCALFIAALCLYTFTLNPDVQPADSGELQIVAITLGIAHPPGYPLFSILGWLFAQVPLGSPYARVSFLSAISSAGALILVSLTVRLLVLQTQAHMRQPKDGWTVSSSSAATLFGLLAAITLGTSTTFWAEATTTNIRSLTTFFTALMLYAVALSMRQMHDQEAQAKTRRYTFVVVFSLAAGFGIGHHASLVFVGVVFSAFLLIRAIRRKLAWKYLLVAMLVLAGTQLVWLYLPIRDAAGARFTPGNLTTLNGFISHVVARGFSGDMLAFAAPQYLPDRLSMLPTLLSFEFSGFVLLVALLAVIIIVWRRTFLGFTLVLAFILHLFITITYRAPQTVEYALPAWVILCVVLGAGAGIFTVELAHFLQQRRSLVFAGLPTLMIFMSIAIPVARDAQERLYSFTQLAQDRSTRQAAIGVLNNAANGSNVLSQWHQATPMWALQDIEHIRRDVHVIYVYPQGAQSYAVTFAEQAARSTTQGTTYVTSYYVNELSDQHVCLAPQSRVQAWEALPCPITRVTTGPVTSLVFDQHIEVMNVVPASRTVHEGQALDVDVTWRVLTTTTANESLTVRLMRSNGTLATNADIRLDTAMQPMTVHSQRVTLGIPLDLSPGDYNLLIGAYRLTSDGFVGLPERAGLLFPSVDSIGIQASEQQPVTQHPLAHVSTDSMGPDPQLLGVDYDTGIKGQLRVLMHWQLGQHDAIWLLKDAAGQKLGSELRIPPAEQTSKSQYFTVMADIGSQHGLRLSTTGQTIILPDFDANERYIPFLDQVVFIGTSIYHVSDQLKIDARWLATRPIMSDDVVSVRVSGNGFYATNDSVPVLGALPTLKWIRGSLVTDRHVLAIDSYKGTLTGIIVVYDSVTQQPLPALDERYADGITFDIQ